MIDRVRVGRRLAALDQAAEERMTGAFAPGRVLNPRTARSQLMGGMLWGQHAETGERCFAEKVKKL
jgi:hypothetical protein